MPAPNEMTIDRPARPTASSLQETIDSAPPAIGGSSAGRAARRLIAMVEGSSPRWTAETSDLLRSRLRVVAGLYFAGIAAFVLLGIATSSFSEYFVSDHLLVNGSRVITAAVMGLLALGLCHKCKFSLTQLRFAELLAFGVPVVYFLILSREKLLDAATLPVGEAHIPAIQLPWVMTIFIYAMFIPNTWQRALGVLAIIAVAPVALTYYLKSTHPDFATLSVQPHYAGHAAEMATFMAVAALFSTVGVHTIGTLRRQAFDARQLGQYRLKHRIGSGGMGEVYLAKHQMLKRPCAVKLIRPEKAGDPTMLARFEREVRTTAKLSHWNSIDIFDYGRTEDGTFYYVMEYLPGHNIGELVAAYGALPAGRVIYLARQICAALAEAHGIGLIHRDIKPANIFCAYRGGEFDVAKLLDFGLAKPSLRMDDAALTQEGSITGSPLFMSPEQANGSDQLDARSDIYSLGAVMYFALTGRNPFNYNNPIKVLVAHASEPAAPLRDHNPDVSEELEEVVLRCLEKEPDHRFQDATELRQTLDHLALDEPWSGDQAEGWWNCHGCPERKKLAAEAVEAAAV